MRTTITLAPEKKATLQTIAAERGERSVSRIVEEAIAFYLSERDRPAAVVQPIAPEIVTIPLPAPAPLLGPWQRLGLEIDRSTDGNPSIVALIRVLVKSRLQRLRFMRAS